MPGDFPFDQIRALARRARFEALSVAVHDYEGPRGFELESGRVFHAASVIKVAVLLGLLDAVEKGAFQLADPLHVRNRFQSAADGSIFKIDRERDGDAECHRRVGASMRLGELARAMIVRSSNLATNLLLDLVGIEEVRATILRLGIQGVEVRRGVEDHAAFERGLNNEMTAAGAAALFRCLFAEGRLGEASRRVALEILLAQEFNSMIPARLPAGVKVAHKTGEISTHCHDAGIVFCPERPPYVLAIFAETPPGLKRRGGVVAQIAALIHGHLRA